LFAISGDGDSAARIAEAAMIGVSGEKPEIFEAESGTESVPEFNPGSKPKTVILSMQEAASRKVEMLPTDADVLEISIKRFADLAKEMLGVISELSRSVQESGNQLNKIDAQIEQKKKELANLHAIDAAVVSIQQLEEAQQAQKHQLERLIADQHSLWEEEKERIVQEEREFMEDLKAQRQREEDAYRRAKDSEHLEIQRKFKQELQAISQKARERQDAREGELRQREQALLEKERESALLVQALEEFLSQMEMRLNPERSLSTDLQYNRAFLNRDPAKPLSGAVHEAAASILMPANEMALSLHKDANQDSGIPSKQESTLLKFSFKNPVSS
jgi:DNA repair exonuclease SbcCD ATPase subunit